MVDRVVAIIVPMLGRPHRIVPLLESIEATTPMARTLFVVSPDDAAVHAELDRVGAERITVPYSPGDYARKINTGYRYTTEPLLFTGAIDLRFHHGWLDQATSHLEAGIGVVGTQDLGNPRVIAGEHSTHSLITRAYADTYGTADAPGEIYHEGYWHEMVDDELVETAKSRNAWAFAHRSIVEHEHYDWGKAPLDDLYSQQRRRMQHGAPLLQQRRALWT